MKFEMIFAEEIDVKLEDGLAITINKDKTIYFGATSNITKMYIEDKNRCLDLLEHGFYFFMNGKFIDHRDSSYDGYIMEDHDIERMLKIVGYKENMKSADIKMLHFVTTGSYDYVLMSDVIERRQFSEGYIELFWTWSPFSKYLRYSYKLDFNNGHVFYNKNFNMPKPKIYGKNWFEFTKAESKKFLDYLHKNLNESFSIMDEKISSDEDIQLYNEHAIEYNLEVSGKMTNLDLYKKVIGLLNYSVNGYLLKLANNLIWK